MKRVKTLSGVIFFLSSLVSSVNAMKRTHVDEAGILSTNGKKPSSKRLQMLEEETFPLTPSLENFPDNVLENISSYLGIRDYCRLRVLSHRFCHLLERQKYSYQGIILREVREFHKKHPRHGRIGTLSRQSQAVLQNLKPYDQTSEAISTRTNVAALSLTLSDILADGGGHTDLARDCQGFAFDPSHKTIEEFQRELETFHGSLPLLEGLRPPLRMDMIQRLRPMDRATLTLIHQRQEVLFAPPMTCYGRTKILEALSFLKGDQIMAFLENADVFFAQNPSFHENVRIIQILGTREPSDIIRLARAFSLLETHNQRTFGRGNFLESLTHLNPDHLELLVQYQAQLLVPSASWKFLRELVEGLGKITLPQLRMIGIHGGQLFMTGSGVPHRLKRLEELKKLSPEAIQARAGDLGYGYGARSFLRK